VVGDSSLKLPEKYILLIKIYSIESPHPTKKTPDLPP